jgi:SulP family sulfate permease
MSKQTSSLSFRLARFRPVLLDALQSYSTKRLMGDLSAGVTVGIVALPLAMAFAIASGLKPEAGIFTGIVAGFIISALGGSRIQIGGPAGAFIVVVYEIVARYGIANLLLATMLAGVLLFLMGLLRLGKLVRFIPVSIISGFTNGIAVLIGLSQLKDFLGLRIDDVPAEFFAKLQTLATHLHSIDPATLALGLVSLAIVSLWPKSYSDTSSRFYRIVARLPGTIVALALATIAVSYFNLPVDTIGSRFGEIPRSLPQLALPTFEWATVQHLFAPAVTIALLCAIESLLCARAADNLTEDRHDPNQELMAQGIANIATPLFGGFCATGTIARTMTNIRAGASSPISGIVHALVLLLILLVAAPLAEDIPLAALAAILLSVAYNMGEWREFAQMKRFAPNHRIIFLCTFILTIVIDLSVAVEVGILLSCLFFIIRVAQLTQIELLTAAETRQHGLDARVDVYRVVGALFFGSMDQFEALLDPRRDVPPVTLLNLSAVFKLDATGLDAIESLHALIRRRGGHLILAGMQAGPAALVRRKGLAEAGEPPYIVATFEEAAALARQLSTR